MNIHEYQAKEVLRRYGVATLKGGLAHSPDEATKVAKEIGGSVWVVKAQIHAGGRGKGGGVKVAKSIDEVKTYAQNIIGMNLVTHQTGPEGKKVQKVYIEQGCNIAKEYYVACLVDRATGRVAMMASSEGGMDIEEVAAHNPNAIIKVDIDQVSSVAYKEEIKAMPTFVAYFNGKRLSLTNVISKHDRGHTQMQVKLAILYK